MNISARKRIHNLDRIISKGRTKDPLALHIEREMVNATPDIGQGNLFHQQ